MHPKSGNKNPAAEFPVPPEEDFGNPEDGTGQPVQPQEEDAPGAEAFCDPVAETARRFFSVPYLYPWQRMVTGNILDAVQAAEQEMRTHAGPPPPEEESGDGDSDGFMRGKQIVILPTGAGKSLCFQVPALLLPAATLVIYPLLALMHDQAGKLQRLGIEAVLFKGGQSAEERKEQFRRLENGAKIILANPEILADRNIRNAVRARGISHTAVDEAHCVSEWGDTFRPAYLALQDILPELSAGAVTAFTATASPPVLQRVKEVLFGGSAHVVQGDTDRENLVYSVIPCTEKDPALVRLIARAERPAVVFCGSRSRTQRLAAMLREYFDDPDIRYYHAGLLREEKIRTELWFAQAGHGILCTTCAWGMGVDVKNIRTVIHYDPPPTVESYIQEAGRGGRDGLESKAILLWNAEDRKNILAATGSARARAEGILRFAESGKCRRDVLLETLGGPDYGAEGQKKACAGCDICRQEARFVPAETELAEMFVRQNKRRYTLQQSAGILCEQANDSARKIYGKRLWRTKTFAVILRKLKEEQKIRTGVFLWKDKLTVSGGRNGTTQPEQKERYRMEPSPPADTEPCPSPS